MLKQRVVWLVGVMTFLLGLGCDGLIVSWGHGADAGAAATPARGANPPGGDPAGNSGCVSDPDRPGTTVCDQGSEWACVSRGSTTICQKADYDVPGGSLSDWTCTDLGEFTQCVSQTADAPTNNPGWTCTPVFAGKVVCISGSNDQPADGGPWSCVYDDVSGATCTSTDATGSGPDSGVPNPEGSRSDGGVTEPYTPSCGNGVVDPGETCDPPGSCPTSCDDGNACTTDTLSGSAAYCYVTCTHSPISYCYGGDGCCPPGCTPARDTDCPGVCGDGIVSAGETCDPPGSCPTSCDDGNACTVDTLASGSAATCNPVCSHQLTTACVGGDGCCPAGCTSANDSDCSLVGCLPSSSIAFVTCDPQLTVQPAGYSITVLSCDAVESAIAGGQHPLAAYDTIAFFGSASYDPDRGLTTARPAVLEVMTRLNEGAKVIVFAESSSSTFMGLNPHFHEVPVSVSDFLVTETNTMSSAFDAARFQTMNLVQVNDYYGEWCGDVFFGPHGNISGAYNGHFHGYLPDNATRKGLLIYVGLNYYTTKLIDFAEPFLAAHFAQPWDRSAGTSAACGLTCTRTMGIGVGKPVIYLYPPVEERVTVKLDFDGRLVTTYPAYDEAIGGWDVVARPDGTLTNVADGQEYSYIFWDGISSSFLPDFSSGFVVRGADTVTFLQDTLSRLGLLPREYNELIVYWLPYMQNHAYNLIHFAKEEYTSVARMTITPEPDALLRVFMVFKELAEPVDVPEQPIVPFERRGFTVVEWGASEIGGDWSVLD